MVMRFSNEFHNQNRLVSAVDLDAVVSYPTEQNDGVFLKLADRCSTIKARSITDVQFKHVGLLALEIE